MHDAVHIDAGQMDVVRRDLADLDNLLHFHDADLARSGCGRVEVARRQAELQIAALVGAVCLDQRHVGHQRALHHIGLAVELAQLLPSATMVPTPVLVKKGDAGAASAQLLGQRALGREFQLQLARQVLALELLVLAHIGRDHFLDLARLQQLAQAETVHAGIVRGHGQPLDTAGHQRIDQGFGNAAQAKAANGQQLPVSHNALERRFCGWVELFTHVSFKLDALRYYVLK